jgi:hypothetical protein
MKKRYFIYINITVILLGLLLIWYAGRPKPERTVSAAPAQLTDSDSQELAQRDVTLYFASADGDFLVSENRLISCRDEEDCAAEVVRALISGSQQDGVAVLPSRAQIHGATFEAGTAILDFSPELSTGHPGGSQSELLTIYALANSVAVNFPHIRQVAIRIDGQPVETLKGHVDLRRPQIADFTFARQSITKRLEELSDDGQSEKEE